MQCVILAGGLGTRISALAGALPKTLLPVAGRPFAYYQLDWLRAQGVTEVVYCIGHKGQMLRDALGDGSERGLHISYCDEGESLRGTGGAIRLAADRHLLRDGFFVLYGDSYLPIAIAPVWHQSGAGRDPTMVVFRNGGLWDRSNVRYAGGRVQLYRKNEPDPAAAGMNFIDYGLAVLNLPVIDRIPPDRPFDLAELYTALSREDLLLGYEVGARFYEIGSPSGLAELEALLARKASGKSGTPASSDMPSGHASGLERDQ